MDQEQNHAKGIKNSIENIIGADTTLKRRRKTENDLNREKFFKIIKALETINNRSGILEKDLQIDMSSYDKAYYDIIDPLLELYFGKEASEIIFFYVYDRINVDGTINNLLDSEDKIVPLNSPSDLWDLICYVKEKSKKEK